MKDTTADTKDDSFDDFDLDAFFEENDLLFSGSRGADKAAVRKGGAKARQTAAGGADPNATMSYAALGEDYPEIPLVGKGARQPDPTAGPTSRLGGGGGKDDGHRGASSRPRSRSESTGGQAGSATKSASPARAPAGTTMTALAGPQSFQQAHYADSSYYIRGGGGHHLLRSPLLLGSLAVIVLVGAVLLGVFLLNTYDGFVKDKADEKIVVLTPAETRSAIDSQMPILFHYLLSTVDGALASFTEAGWNVRADPRASTNNPDGTAVGGRIIHFSPSVDLAVLDQGYFEGGYDAYDFDELQRSFNGSWVIDVSQGNLGAYAQLEYVNFAAESLDAELEHFRAAQGLADENAVVDSQDVDSHGNTFVRGYSVIEGTTYYWEFIGIAFADYYGGQDRRTLPPTAVFVKCKFANYDFYGVGSAPAAGNGATAGTDGTGTEGAGDAETEGAEGAGEGTEEPPAESTDGT